MACKKEVLQESRSYSLPFYIAIGILVLLPILFAIVYAIDGTLPSPLSQQHEEENPDRFIAERAHNFLDGLVKIGPRLTGSIANEETAVNYILEAISDTLSSCKRREDIELDHQVVSGSFYFEAKPYGWISAYKSIQNIVVRLASRTKTSSSVLINAHFDTKPKSPGGCDDGIMCAIMLEVLRNVCKLEDNKNNLIFLFNGAEESSLQGSHGFITNANKWNDSISVVINLESAGAAGKEALFQTGPAQSWLMEYYRTVPYPHGQVAGEEIFKSGIIPSDTDFRIFRDFGDTVGYDMAFSRDGYRYHTEYDGIAGIELGVYQRTGDNVLALVRALANAEEVSKPRSEPNNPVYYDFIGLFLIYYGETGEIAINVVTILFSFVIAIIAFLDFKFDLSMATLKYLSLTFLSILVGWLIAIGLVVAIAASLDALYFAMGWYGHTWIIICIYSLPVVTSLIGSSILMNKFIRYKNFTINIHAQIQLHANRLFWTLLLIVGVCLRIRTVYVLVLPILFTSFAFLLIQLLQKQYSYHTWHFVYTIFTILPSMFSIYVSLEIFGTIVPVCGRIGSEVNSELLIGVAGAVLTIFIVSFYVPIIAICRKIFHIYIILIIISIFVFLILTVYYAIHSSSGYPYNRNVDKPYVSEKSSSEESRTPQRFWIYHTNRIIRNSSNDIVKEDAGIYFENMDRNSPQAIEHYVGFMGTISQCIKSDCELALYCGLSVRRPTSIEQIEKYIWIPANDVPIIDEPVHLTLKSKTSIGENIFRYTFTASGTSHYHIYLSPRKNTFLIQTDLLDEIPKDQPKWNGQETYFILYLDGKERVDFTFSFDIQAEDNAEPLVDIAIAGDYCDENVLEKSDHYKSFLESFPPWTSVLGCTGSYENWVY